MVDEFEIADKVRIARSTLGLTQSDVAKAVGVSRQTIAKVEAGFANQVTFGSLIKILEHVGYQLSLSYGIPYVIGRPVVIDDDVKDYVEKLYAG